MKAGRLVLVLAMVLVMSAMLIPAASAAPIERGSSLDGVSISDGGLDRACIDLVCREGFDGRVQCKCRVNELPYFKGGVD